MDIHTLTSMQTKAEPYQLLYLLHISDPMLPIGGFTQSFGLETYVQKGIVNGAAASRDYLESYLSNSFLFNDLLAVRLAWEYADRGDLEEVIRLDRLLCAAKAPRELRVAGIKLGTRFSKIMDTVLREQPLYNAFMQTVEDGRCAGSYSILFGIAARLLGIRKLEALSAITYNSASSIVNNCTKLIPISQKDGQNILFAAHGTMRKIIQDVESLDAESIGTSCFGFDLRAMQHERLYTRLYIS